MVNFQASGLILSVNSVIYGVKKSNVHLQLAAGREVGWLGPPGHPRWLPVLGGLSRAAAGGGCSGCPCLSRPLSTGQALQVRTHEGGKAAARTGAEMLLMAARLPRCYLQYRNCAEPQPQEPKRVSCITPSASAPGRILFSGPGPRSTAFQRNLAPAAPGQGLRSGCRGSRAGSVPATGAAGHGDLQCNKLC